MILEFIYLINKYLNMNTMTTITRFFSGIALFIAAIILFSCNLDDFNLKKLANPTDIVPDIYAPLGYGTFKVDDLVTAPILDSTPIPAGGLVLDPLVVSKNGTSFRTAAIDSVYLIIHLTNDTPAEAKFELSFFDSSAGVTLGIPFDSGIIPANTKDKRIQFNLGPNDQDNLMNSTDLKISFSLSSPVGSNILYKVVKSTSITVKIGFHAPVNLWKL